MKASIGRIVTFKGHYSNGTDEHPAIITRVWGGEPMPGVQVVNLTVLPDCGQPFWQSSVYLFENRATAEVYGGNVAFWPDRVDSPGLVGATVSLENGTANFTLPG